MRRALCVIVLLGTLSAWGEPTVRFRADRNSVQVGVPFQLILEISGGRIGQPTFPEVPGLTIQPRPVNSFSSTQVEFAAGSMKTVKKTMYAYLARATQPGKMTIPGPVVEVDGQNLTPPPVTITVAGSGAPTVGPPQANTPPAAMPAGAVSSPAEAAGNQEGTAAPVTKDPTWEDAAYVETSVDKQEVYEGESLILTLSLGELMVRGLQVHPLQGQDRVLPSTEGFYTVVLQQEQQSKAQRKGFDYVVEQRRVVLCPTVAGDLKIGGWHWEGVGLHNFQERGISLDAPPISIKVKPLPARPSGFSGAVGSFTVEAQVERMSAVQGTPVRLLVKITGQGNPDSIGEPTFPKLENAYVGDSEKDIKTVETPSGFTVTKTFSYAITPLTPGEMIIPELEFCYFNPVENSFKTEKTQAFKVAVTASNEVASRMVAADPVPAQEGQVRVLGEDIQPPIAQAGALTPSRPLRYTGYLVTGTPVLAYGALALVMRRKRKFATDHVFARAHGAKARARKRLALIAKSSEPTEEAYRAVAGFIADIMDVPEGGITSSDVPRLFAERGFNDVLAKDVSALLKACERVRYGSERLDKDAAILAGEAAALVERLDSAGKERRR